MYRFDRLLVLLRALSVARPSRRQLVLRWLWMLLQCLPIGVFVVALARGAPYDQPASWRDIFSFDASGRAFFISAYVSLAAGFYTAASFGDAGAAMVTTLRARIGPPPGMALALRQAMRVRDSRVAPLTGIELPAPAATSGDAGAFLGPTLVVSAPETLLRLVLWDVMALVGGALALWGAVYFASDLLARLDDMSPDYLSLWLAGVLVMMSASAFTFVWRSWAYWQGRTLGVEVTPSAEGLTIRGPETLWSPRFIRWDAARSLARFTYKDDNTRAHTAYMLDADNQTLLWESPPDRRYAMPSRRAALVWRQASAARLVALATIATGLPLLDISEIVDEISGVQPDLSSASLDITLSDDASVIAITVKPSAEDVALLEFLYSAGAEAEKDGDPAPPPPTTAPRLEQWRRLFGSLLNWGAAVAAAYFFWILTTRSGF